jgi:hypothetical protein
MTSAARSHPSLSAIEELLAGFGRATGKFMVVAVDHGPEVLAALAQIQVEGEYVRLLQAEWANHPLLDFIEWQDMSAAQILALTMPQEAVLGHAELADLLRPVCTAPATLDALERVVRAPELASFAADEFLDGLATVRTRRLDRAVTRLTVGLEGLLRITAVTQGGLTDVEARKLDSGYELVKRLWSDRSHYKAYMKAWVFGMSNTYRHGDDGGAAEQQALHALCGAAIWSQHLMRDGAPLQRIRAGLNEEITRRFSIGTLTVQPSAEKRLQRAAEAIDKSGSVDSLLELRSQLLEMRTRGREASSNAAK